MSKYCFICGKETDSKGKGDTCLVSKPQKAEYIHTHAIEIEDESIISKITTEGQKKINLVDGMYRYHQSCMKTFMNKTCQENPEATSIYERCFMH